MDEFIKKGVDIHNFVELVRQMRHNQKRYNNVPKSSTFSLMKNYEREVDRILSELNDTQKNIFE